MSLSQIQAPTHEGDSFPPLTKRPLTGPESLRFGEGCPDVWLLPRLGNALYEVGFVGTLSSLQRSQRLRFEVFNLELREGLMTSLATGLDCDDFDGQMTHLVVLERATQRVVGTYRLQTAEQARSGRGFYSSGEYDLTGLGEYLHVGVECGRACIAPEHRSVATLLTLWQGIIAYLNLTGTRWVFGCCSLTTLDSDDGWRALQTLRQHGVLHDSIWLPARPTHSCRSPDREYDSQLGPPITLPKLFSAYLRLGAKVISEPALDREFGTVDFLILLDTHSISLSSLSMASIARKLRPQDAMNDGSAPAAR